MGTPSQGGCSQSNAMLKGVCSLTPLFSQSSKWVNTNPPKYSRKLFNRPNCFGWARVRHADVGLQNKGNTCFLNSVLQLLFHTPSFNDWLDSELEHLSQCRAKICITCCLLDLRQQILKSPQASSITPTRLLATVKKAHAQFCRGRQEDCHEFLMFLFDQLDKEFLSRFLGQSIDYCTQLTSVTPSIFGGWMKSCVQCSTCGRESTTYNAFSQLNLAPLSRSVQDGVNNFLESEEVNYSCEICYNAGVTLKKFSVFTPPQNLSLQVGRFDDESHKVLNSIIIDRTIELPGCGMFRLIGGILHLGETSQSGHYIAFSMCPDGFTRIFDDSKVSICNISRAISSPAWSENCYILFYERDERIPPIKIPSPPKTVGNPEDNLKKISVSCKSAPHILKGKGNNNPRLVSILRKNLPQQPFKKETLLQNSPSSVLPLEKKVPSLTATENSCHLLATPSASSFKTHSTESIEANILNTSSTGSLHLNTPNSNHSGSMFSSFSTSPTQTAVVSPQAQKQPQIGIAHENIVNDCGFQSTALWKINSTPPRTTTSSTITAMVTPVKIRLKRKFDFEESILKEPGSHSTSLSDIASTPLTGTPSTLTAMVSPLKLKLGTIAASRSPRGQNGKVPLPDSPVLPLPESPAQEIRRIASRKRASLVDSKISPIKIKISRRTAPKVFSSQSSHDYNIVRTTHSHTVDSAGNEIAAGSPQMNGVGEPPSLLRLLSPHNPQEYFQTHEMSNFSTHSEEHVSETLPQSQELANNNELQSTCRPEAVLLTEDDVPGAKLQHKDVQKNTKLELKRWLQCRAIARNGNKAQLVARVKAAQQMASSNRIDPAVDDGKWYDLKMLQVSGHIPSTQQAPAPTTSDWNVFPSTEIPLMFNYGHIYYYLIESESNVFRHEHEVASDSEDEEAQCSCDEDDSSKCYGCMAPSTLSQTERFDAENLKPFRRGLQFMKSRNIRAVEDLREGTSYFVRAQVRASMVLRSFKTEVAISCNSGNIARATCQCFQSARGKCSHVSALLLYIWTHIKLNGHGGNAFIILYFAPTHNMHSQRCSSTLSASNTRTDESIALKDKQLLIWVPGMNGYTSSLMICYYYFLQLHFVPNHFHFHVWFLTYTILMWNNVLTFAWERTLHIQ